MGFWDDPDLAAGGDYLALSAEGDTISGIITNMRRRVFDNGQVAAELTLKTDGETVINGQFIQPGDYSFTGGAYQVKLELNRLRPTVGDHIKVVRGKLESIKGGKSVGHYVVEIRGGTQPAPQAQPQYQQQTPQQYQQQAPQQYQQPQAVQYQQPAPQQQVQPGPGPFQQPQQQPVQAFEPPF